MPSAKSVTTAQYCGLLRRQFLDIKQRSFLFGGSVAWHPKIGCERDYQYWRLFEKCINELPSVKNRIWPFFLIQTMEYIVSFACQYWLLSFLSKKPALLRILVDELWGRAEYYGYFPKQPRRNKWSWFALVVHGETIIHRNVGESGGWIFLCTSIPFFYFHSVTLRWIILLAVCQPIKPSWYTSAVFLIQSLS